MTKPNLYRDMMFFQVFFIVFTFYCVILCFRCFICMILLPTGVVNDEIHKSEERTQLTSISITQLIQRLGTTDRTP